MKNFTGFLSVIISITGSISSTLAIGYTNSGDFSKVIPCIIVSLGCIPIIYSIAKSNDKKIKKEEELEEWYEKHEAFCIALQEALEE